MSHQQLLQTRVTQVQRRARILIAQQWSCIGLTAGLLLALPLVLSTRMLWWTDAVDYLWAPALAGAVLGGLFGWTRRVTPMQAAILADERAGLKERLSTALWLSAAGSESALASAQLADAATHAESLRATSVLPWRPPQHWKWLLGALTLLLAVVYLPSLPFFRSPQDRIDQEAMRLQGAQMQKVAKDLEKQIARQKDDPNGEILRRVAREMQRLGKDQARGRVPKKQALLKMNELQRQLKEAGEKMGGSGRASKSTDAAADEMKQAAERARRQGDQERARQLEQMADNLKKKDFDGARKQLEQLAQKMKEGKMSAEEAGKAAEMLQQMAQSMSGSDLEKASQQLKQASKELQKAAQEARKLQQQMASAKSDAERQKLQQQASQQLQQCTQKAGDQTQQSASSCQSSGQNQQAASQAQQLSQALQSAQQSLQRAGQKSAQSGQQGEASPSEMGEEFQPGQSGSPQSTGGQQGGKPTNGQQGSRRAQGSQGGRGGFGGSAGAQQPLPGVKANKLAPYQVDEKGRKLTRSYMGTPDPTQDRAAYYSVAPESRRAAEASLGREDIPNGYKKQVRDYFDAIQPR